jgi:hypothetical protein
MSFHWRFPKCADRLDDAERTKLVEAKAHLLKVEVKMCGDVACGRSVREQSSGSREKVTEVAINPNFRPFRQAEARLRVRQRVSIRANLIRRRRAVQKQMLHWQAKASGEFLGVRFLKPKISILTFNEFCKVILRLDGVGGRSSVNQQGLKASAPKMQCVLSFVG